MQMPTAGTVAMAAALMVASGAVTAAEHADEPMSKRLNDLESQVRSLQEATTANRLDTVSKQHLAGYGDLTYTGDLDDGEGAFTRALFAPIFHYQYDDLLLFEGELEFEVEEGGDTDVALEYVTLDLLLNDYMALVAGKFLSPVGQFRQNLHPSWINKLPNAPAGFGHGGAAPLSDVGAQLRGGFPIAGPARANYAVYVANGPLVKAELHEEDSGDLEVEAIELESEGFAADPDGKKVFGGRIGLLPVPELELGLSGAFGQVGTATVAGHDGELEVTPTDNRNYSVLGADILINWRGSLQLRAEYVLQRVESTTVEGVTAEGVEGLGEELEFQAWYTQAAYKLPSTKFEGVVRYGDVDVPGSDLDRSQWAVGVNYLFASNVIAKAAVELDDFDAGDVDDEERFVLQLAYGF